MKQIISMKIFIFLLHSLSSSWSAPLTDEKSVELPDDGVHNHMDLDRSGKYFKYNQFNFGVDITSSGQINANKVSFGNKLSITIGESKSKRSLHAEEPALQENPITGRWSDYGPCNKICGGGMKERTCWNPTPEQIRRSCIGSYASPCNVQPCKDVSSRDAIKALKALMKIIVDGLYSLEKISSSKRSVESFTLNESKLLDILFEVLKFMQNECNVENGYCELEAMQSFAQMSASTFKKIQASGKITPGFIERFVVLKKEFDREAAMAENVQADLEDVPVPYDDPQLAGLPETCSSSEIIPHPTDCHKFVHCAPGHSPAEWTTCPDGLRWNQKMSYCDWEDNVPCPTLTDCSPGPDLLVDDCFCKNNDGKREECTAGKICHHGVCLKHFQDCTPGSNHHVDGCICKNANGNEEICTLGQTCLDGVCRDKICNTHEVNSEDCFCKGEISRPCKAGDICLKNGKCKVACTAGEINSGICLCGIENKGLLIPCKEGQGCTKDGKCLDVCSAEKKNYDACFCQVGSSGVGEACSTNQGCTKDGTCLDVCAADEARYGACFCEVGYTGGGAVCDAYRKCNKDGTCRPKPKRLPSKVLGLYLLLSEWRSRQVSEPKLHEYQQSGANVLFFTWIHPTEMDVPEAFQELAATRGTEKEGAVPTDTKIIFAIGGETYSDNPNPWPWLSTKSKAEEMAVKVAKWMEYYNCDGIDLDIEKGAGNQPVAGQNMIHFVKKIKELQPDMIITQPVWGYPGQVPANDEMVNAAWTPGGSSNGLLDSVGIMVYNNLESLDWVHKYTDGKSPITAKVPHDKILVGIQGTASSWNIESLAKHCISKNLLGIMVWVSSVKNGFSYGDDSSKNEESMKGFKKTMEIFRRHSMGY